MTGVKLKDILNIPIFAKARVLSGKGGLEKHATTVSVAEVPDILSWAKEGALYLTTLYAFRKKDAQRNLVRGLWEKGASGLVVKAKRFLDTVPAEMIDEAKALGFPLIEMPPEVIWSELIPDIFEKILEEEVSFKAKGNFVEALLAGDYSSEEEIVGRGESVGCNLKNSYQVLVVDIDNFSLYLIHERPTEDEVQKVKEALTSFVQEELEKRFVRHFMLQKSNGLVLLAEAREKEKIVQAAQTICDRTRERLRLITVSMGIGEVSVGAQDIKRSFTEATKALRVVHILRGGDSIARYHDVEDYVLLANLADAPELDSYLQSTLGKLIDYDAKNRAGLLETLKAYFLYGENKAQAARALFIHLNTLKYRLHKIEEILDFKFSDMEPSFRLKLATRLLRFRSQRVDGQ